MNPNFGTHLLRWFLGISLIPHVIHFCYALIHLGWVMAVQGYLLLIVVTAATALAAITNEEER